MSPVFPAIEFAFKEKPVKARIARGFVNLGISVRGGKLFVGNIEIPIKAVSDALDINRKTVYSFISEVEGDFVLREIFSRISPVSDISRIAPILGYEVITADVMHSDIGKFVRIISSSSNIIYLHFLNDRLTAAYEPGLSRDNVSRLSRIGRNMKLVTPDLKKRRMMCKRCKVEYCPRRMRNG